MPSRPSFDSIEVLRRTLMEVERDFDPVSDAAALSSLKRIVLNRIAELELQQAQETRPAGRSIPPLSITSSSPQPQTDRRAPDSREKS